MRAKAWWCATHTPTAEGEEGREELQAEMDKLGERVEVEAAARREVEERDVQLLERLAFMHRREAR